MSLSKYKGVSLFKKKGGKDIENWAAQGSHKGVRWMKTFRTEREAAIGYDMKMIQLGKEPVNILKRKDA